MKRSKSLIAILTCILAVQGSQLSFGNENPSTKMVVEENKDHQEVLNAPQDREMIKPVQGPGLDVTTSKELTSFLHYKGHTDIDPVTHNTATASWPIRLPRPICPPRPVRFFDCR